MEIKEIIEKNTEELKRMLAEKRLSLLRLRFDIAAKQVKNNRQIRNEKRNIARILTLINKKKK